jgi:hypothetical protein
MSLRAQLDKGDHPTILRLYSQRRGAPFGPGLPELEVFFCPLSHLPTARQRLTFCQCGRSGSEFADVQGVVKNVTHFGVSLGCNNRLLLINALIRDQAHVSISVGSMRKFDATS